jgi:hypothetical protein
VAGVRDLLDSVSVRHVSGQPSQIKLKSYDQGRLRWQAATLEWVYFDEKPDEFRLYHRKDGLVVKEHDDIMAANGYRPAGS